MKKALLIFTAVFLFTHPTWSQVEEAPHVRAELFSEVNTIVPGEPFWMGVELSHNQDWHTYYKDPGDSGLPTKIIWDLPEGFEASEIHWPKPEIIDYGELVSNGYHGKAVLLTKITPSKDLAVGNQITISANVKWLACKEICIPGETDLSVNYLVTSVNTLQYQDFFQKARNNLDSVKSVASNEISMSISLALIFAFVGGLILNLMPCVLPVLSIKVLGLLKYGDDKKYAWMNGLAFAGGVLVSFWILSGLLFILKVGGHSIGWGFQFQSPNFIVFMASLLFLIGLNMFGLFEVGASLTGVGQNMQKGVGLIGSFNSGILTTIVATPCTAPFMGAALGYALSQPFWVGFLIFTSLGIGLSFPYILLTVFPDLLRILPKPGPWMVYLKKFLGLLMMVSVSWLAWVLSFQVTKQSLMGFLVSLLIIGASAWVYGNNKSKKSVKISALIIILACVVVNILNLDSKESRSVTTNEKVDVIQWQNYSQELIDKLKSEKKRIFIDFTATWCLSCQVNERVVFHNKNVIHKFRELNIVPIKGDWTNRSEEITEALAGYGKNSIPLYVIYGDNSEQPMILPEIITPQMVIDALDSINN